MFVYRGLALELEDYNDVVDGWLRPNVLMTSLRCWWPIQDVDDQLKNQQHNEKSRQHNNSTIKISNQSSSKSHQHNDVTNITVTDLDPWK